MCTWIVNLSISEVSASSEVFYENEDLYEDGDCMRIWIRTRVMRLMSYRAYAYAYGRLYQIRSLALEIEQSVYTFNKDC